MHLPISSQKFHRTTISFMKTVGSLKIQRTLTDLNISEQQFSVGIIQC
jgi:hypothetical protein